MMYSIYFQVKEVLLMLAFIVAFSLVIFVFGVIKIYRHLKQKYNKNSKDKEV